MDKESFGTMRPVGGAPERRGGELYWKQTRADGVAPSCTNDEDAGWDLTACETTKIEAGGWGNIPIGIAVELPYATWGMITGRSSTLAKRRLLVPVSVIDSGFRGELFVFAWNMNEEAVEVEKGARLGQLILVPRWLAGAGWVESEELTTSRRGTGGFGSTGK